MRRLLALLLPLAYAASAGAQGAPAPLADTGAVRRGISVQPETVTVGLPFRVQVRVRAPAGSRMEFPIGPDSSATVELLDPKRVQTTDSVGAFDQTAVYRMVAWDLGDQPIRMGDVVIMTPAGERRVPLGGLEVHVKSVLPQDSAQRVPKPPRPPFAIDPPWWRHWWIAALALAAAVLAWWLWRRRRRDGDAEPPIDPYEFAEREFARVERMGLVEAGERGRFVALMVEVLRDYLARRVPDARPSLTSGELLRALQFDPAVPVDRLAVVLAESDLIKFARQAVSAERARELATEARAIVREVDRAVAEREAAAAAAAAAAKDRESKREAA